MTERPIVIGRGLPRLRRKPRLRRAIALLDGVAAVHSWEGPTETALYAYGTSFESMRDALAGFLRSYPLCEKARVVQIA